MQLTNTVAWITGAGKRIGRALALELARRGCDLAIHYGSSAAEAHEVARAAEDMGRRTLVYRANLAKVDEIRSMAGQIENEFGRLDILINSAANFNRVLLEDITEADWDHALDVNLKGAAFCALEASRLMRLKRGSGETLASASGMFAEPQPISLESYVSDKPDSSDASASNGKGGIAAPTLWGKIINFADWSALRPHKHFLPYMISKGGIVTLTQTLAQELAPEITVNAIAPGTVLPPEDSELAALEKITANIPLRRIGSPQDIVATALYMLEGTDYISGQVVCVDGGRFVSQPNRA